MKLRRDSWICALLLLGACTTSESAKEPAPATEHAISFGVEEYSLGRATLIENATQAEFRAQPFRVFAHLIPFPGAEPEDVFNDVYVAFDSYLNGWDYAPPKFWEPTGQYEFRGFWPSKSLVEGTATTASLVLGYSMASDNDDLMVAYYTCPTKNPDPNGNIQAVPLTFHHALSAVSVKFRTGLNAQQRYTVKNVYFTSLYLIGSLSFTQEYAITEKPAWKRPDGSSYWSPKSRAADDEISTQKVREWSGNEEVPITTDVDNPQYVTLPWQLMIPQSLLLEEIEGDRPVPGIAFTIEVEWGDEIEQKTMWLPLPTDTVDEWEPGKRYTYAIALHPNSFGLTVQTVPWDEVQGVAPDIEFN